MTDLDALRAIVDQLHILHEESGQALCTICIGSAVLDHLIEIDIANEEDDPREDDGEDCCEALDDHPTQTGAGCCWW